MNKNRILILSIILLLLANIATLATYWFNRLQKHPAPAHGPGKAAAFLENSVGFDEGQKRQYAALITEHRQQTEGLREDVRKSKETLFSLLKIEPLPDSLLTRASAEAAKAMQEIDLVTFRHFKKVRALCRPDQLPAFDRVIGEVLAMMSRRPGPPGNMPPPPPGHGPGPGE